MILRVADGSPIESLRRHTKTPIVARCGFCEGEYETRFFSYQRSAKIAGKARCRPCAIKAGRYRSGSDHGRWKGGRKKMHDGVVMVHKPSARRSYPYVYEYVAIMEDHLGREMQPREHVHHIDGDRHNNDLSNLVVLDTVVHKKAHYELEKIGYELVKAGLVIFDREKGTYVQSPALVALLAAAALPVAA